MKSINNLRGDEESFFEVLFSDDIWTILKYWIKYYYKDKKTANYYDYKDGNIAANYGYLQLILEKQDLKFTCLAIDYAAEHGYLQVVQYLHYNRFEGCTTLAMDKAAINGHFDVVEFLHHNRKEGCTIFCLDLAIKNRHQKIVKFLRTNRTEFRKPKQLGQVF